MRKCGTTSILVVCVLLAMISGCSSSGGSVDPALITLTQVNDLYYKVDIRVSSATHYEIGRQLAVHIQYMVPDYETQVDAGLKAMLDTLKKHAAIEFSEVVQRAQQILPNVPAEYQDEIRGIQSVYSGTDDTLGNGKLSKNKILVYNLAPDVMRVLSCSASAAFGAATADGRTIMGRNLEWLDGTLSSMAALHAVVQIHNDGNSVVLFGFLGQMSAISGFNSVNVFGAILDSPTYMPYLGDEKSRSYPMDLRYALEHQSTLQAVANTFNGKKYAYGFNIFLADQNTSAVLEVDPSNSFSGLRTSKSILKDDTKVKISSWSFDNAIACVNWFTLPGTIDNTGGADYIWAGNAPRWDSFISLFGKYLAQGSITMEVMKSIMSYTGSKDNGRAEDGAIWRYDNLESEVQSIIMDMNTYETWVSFQPTGQGALKSPNYIRVFSAKPF